MSKKPLLYVDGLNFFRKAFPQALDWWNLKQFLTNVRMMVKRLEKYDLKVFIDASRVTPEARTKWKSRHETRIRKGKASPPFKETLLGDAFRICNVPVFYSYGAGECY